MSNASRAKGLRGEAEVRALLAAEGWEVRGLEGTGDWLAFRNGKTLHVEVKRQETLRLPLWARQASAEAPRGVRPVVAYRRSRDPWWAITPAAMMPPGSVQANRVIELNREWWLDLPFLALCRMIAEPDE